MAGHFSYPAFWLNIIAVVNAIALKKGKVMREISPLTVELINF